jgi:hypothetical protein
MILLVVASADNGYELSTRNQTPQGTTITTRTEVYTDIEEVKKRALDLIDTVIKNDVKRKDNK